MLAAQATELVLESVLDVDAVSSAVAGVRGAYFCYPVDPRLLEATAIFAQAANEAGVRAVVNMSQISARSDAKSVAAQRHWIGERLLDRTDMMTTHIRPTFFGSWLSREWSPNVAGWTRQGDEAVLRLPFGNGRHAPIAASDQGRFVAAVLADPAPHAHQTYTLTGPVEYDHHEIAAALARTLGISVRYEQIDITTFANALTRQGYPPFLVQHLSSVAQDYRDGIFAGANDLIETVTGIAAMTVEDIATADSATPVHGHGR